MKRYIFIVSIVLSLILLTTGCDKSSKKVIFKDDYGFDTPKEITYKFTGNSKHFAFLTGKVYYGNNNERYLYLDNFEIIDKLKNENKIIGYSINVFFNEKSLFSNELNYLGDDDFQVILDNFKIEETGTYNEDGYGESDAFLETNQNSFKNDINVVIKYCYSDTKCQTEEFEINYVN